MLTEYLRKTRKEIIQLSDNWEKYLRRYLWNSKPRNTKEEIEEFYVNMPDEYLCNLQRQYLKDRERYMKDIKAKGLRVLDFGCGSGDYGFELLEQGAKVDFYDITEHKGMKYLKWRLKEKGLKAKVTTQLEKLESEYDLILCLDVLEHVQKPTETFKMLFNKLPDMGKMILNTLLIIPLLFNKPDNIIDDMKDYEHIEEAIKDWRKNKTNSFISEHTVRNNFQLTKSSLNILLFYHLSQKYPYTTALYIEKELKKFGKVHIANQIGSIDGLTGCGVREYIKKNNINLIIQVESAGWYQIPRNLDIPTIAYSIDTFEKTELKMKFLDRYKYKFFAQKKFAKKKNEYWLPLGVDIDIYKPLNVFARKYEVAFCGTILEKTSHLRRNELLRALVKNTDIYVGRNFEHGANLRYNEALWVFNYGIENLDGKGLSGVNMRVFEGMASGTPTLYPEAEGMEEVGFKDMVHYVKYKDADDLVKKIKDLKSNKGLLSDIRGNALKEIVNHTYGDRVKKMIEVFKNG